MMRKGRGGTQTHFTKPVNAISFVKNTIESGHFDENRIEWENARDVIHSTVINRKFRQFAHECNIQEETMIAYVDLCVKMGDLQFMRDGLFQYRTIAQHANAQSMQKVIEKILSSANTILDVDEEDSVSLKLVWEAYKQVLELIKTTPKLDECYHTTARQAFEFCVTHNRVIEYRRLCDILKWHYTNMTKVKNKTDKAILLQPEIHIKTRVIQLEGACKLKLWRIAHETIEELGNLGLFDHAHKMADRASAMTTYYQGCADVLWYSSNMASEHAEALWKLFQHKERFCLEFAGSSEEKLMVDTLVLAAASASSSDLLDLISRKGVNSRASSEVANLLEYLNSTEDKREMCRDVSKLLLAIQSSYTADSPVLRYFPKIKEIVLTRMVILLQGVYETLNLHDVRETLVPSEFMEWHEAEYVLMNLSKNGSVSVVIDRKLNSITFTNSAAKNGVKSDLLYNTAKCIDSINRTRVLEASDGASTRNEYISNFYDSIKQQLDDERKFYSYRMQMAKEILERETEAAKKEADHARQADVRRREEFQKAEEERQAKAAKRELEQKQQRELQTQRLLIASKIMSTILAEIPRGIAPIKIRGVPLDKLDVADIASQKYSFEEVSAALQKMKSRERNSIHNVREQEEKIVDYTARAIREESIPLWQSEEETLRKRIYDSRAQLTEEAARKHAEAYDLIATQRSLIKNFGEGNIDMANEFINNYFHDCFEEQWPIFKHTVNKMIFKQSMNKLNAKLNPN